MKSLSLKDLKQFLAQQGAPCVSIYLTDSNSGRLLGLLREAERLLEKSYDKKTIEQIMQPLKDYAQSVLFERERKNARAIFFSRHGAGALDLPECAEDLVVVADSYHIKPILHWIQKEKPYYFLSLSQRRAVLYRGDASQFVPLEIIENQPLLKFGEMGILPKRMLERPSKNGLARFFRQVNKKIMKIIQEKKLPLIIGASAQHYSIFTALNWYPFMSDEYLEGNFDTLRIAEIHRQSRQVMSRIVERYEDLLIDEFWRAANANLASDRLHDIAKAAVAGYVKRLYVAENRHIWGNLDRRTGLLRLHDTQKNAHDDDVLDDLAEVVLAKGGDVVVLPMERMPAEAHAAAILRWRDLQSEKEHSAAIAI